MRIFTKGYSFQKKQMQMSKDKGQKNVKKAPADKTSVKSKAISSYKSEGKNGSAVIIKDGNLKSGTTKGN